MHYETGKIVTTQAIVLGLGSVFNHSGPGQNVGWERDVQRMLVRYITLRNVCKGEELCISYGTKLTFEDAEAQSVIEETEDSLQAFQNVAVD
ncbi:MAG: hypothetical protein M1824_000617 [Vezdaea acicularis]|nr:MAG: hypothetical protein M1824_000617 [Vezdaea acicularis]